MKNASFITKFENYINASDSHKKALKKVEKFPKYVKEDMYEIATLLKNFPFVRLDIKKLSGNIYRIRKGKYRMLFRVENNIILIFKIDIRGRVYG
jgi:mRNA-degrading endonuclease RelE of RelBE toxin-antitoxin system